MEGEPGQGVGGTWGGGFEPQILKTRKNSLRLGGRIAKKNLEVSEFGGVGWSGANKAKTLCPLKIM